MRVQTVRPAPRASSSPLQSTVYCYQIPGGGAIATLSAAHLTFAVNS